MSVGVIAVDRVAGDADAKTQAPIVPEPMPDREEDFQGWLNFQKRKWKANREARKRAKANPGEDGTPCILSIDWRSTGCTSSRCPETDMLIYCDGGAGTQGEMMLSSAPTVDMAGGLRGYLRQTAAAARTLPWQIIQVSTRYPSPLSTVAVVATTC